MKAILKREREKERKKEIKIIFEIQQIDTKIGNISVQIIDDGDGFDLTDKNYPVFGRFGKWFDNSKGQNNKGCGRAQFFHYFESIDIKSKGFNEDGQYKNIHWVGSEKNDLTTINITAEGIIEETTIHLQNYKGDKKDFYDKISYLYLLKREIITNCFLKLLNKDITITLQQIINGNKNENKERITKEDLSKYEQDSIEKEITIKYKIYKTQKDHSNKDIGEFTDCEEKEEKFKMNIYKLPAEFKNHVYLCANDVAVKDILISEKLFDKNMVIGYEGKEKYKLLVLINDAENCNFLNEHSNSERDNLDIPKQEDIEKQIKNDGIALTLYVDYSKTPILFYNDLINGIKDKLTEAVPEIKGYMEGQEQKAKEMIEQYKITHNISDSEAEEIGLNNSRTIKSIKDIEKLYQIVGSKRGEKREKLHQKSVEKFTQVLNTITNDAINDKNINDFYNTLNEFHDTINENNRVELSNYVLRRTWQIELFKKLVEKNVKEKFIHNLIFKKGTNSNETKNHELWIINEDFANYDYIASDVKLADIEYKNEKVFSQDIEHKNVLKSCGIENLNKNLKKPDILIFHELGAIIILDFKRPDEACFEYIWQLEAYCRLIATKTQKSRFTNFFCYIIGQKYGVSNAFFTKTADGQGYFCQSYPIKELQGDENIITNAYFEVNNYKNLAKLAELRNKNFSNKLLTERDYDIIKQNTEKITNKISKENEKNKTNKKQKQLIQEEQQSESKK